MSTFKVIFAISLLVPMPFWGCSLNSPNSGGPVSSASQATEAGGVVRQTPVPQSSATPAPPPSLPSGNAVIATRLGSKNHEVDLMRASVTGDILSVELRYRNVGKSHPTINFPVEQVSIIDDATSRRYGVLKDQSGRYMASPLNNVVRGAEDEILLNTSPGEYHVMWFKFPAPSAQTHTVSINVPQVAPFDNIRIQR
jgi:hypothetical protein